MSYPRWSVMNNRPTLHVALEGIDGMGKSTVLPRLHTALDTRGLRVADWSWPHRRAMLDQVKAHPQDPYLWAMFFTLDAVAAMKPLGKLLREARELGSDDEGGAKYDVLLYDRSLWSSLAYQGTFFDNDEDRTTFRRLREHIEIAPDLVLLLDCDFDLAAARDGHVQVNDWNEAPKLRRIQQTYRNFASTEPGLFKVVDASLSIENVVSICMNHVLAFFKGHP